MRVLVAEDNLLNLELVKDLLEMSGHTVEVAQDGRTAVELARQILPDVILMDVQLPRLDGLAATRALKADPTTQDIPVIGLTANAMPDDRRQVLEAGCVGYIAKPIDTVRFLDRVMALVSGEREVA